MELKLRDITICEYNKKISTTCNVEADIIVPDTKPDIYRILCVNATSNLDERYIRKDKIIFSGNVNFNILYIGETDKTKIYNIEYCTPFNHQCDLPGADDNAVSISRCIVAGTDFKVKNSRKLSASGILNIDAEAMKHSMVNAIEDVLGDDAVPFKKKNIKNHSMSVCKEMDFTLSDTITLPYSEDIAEIHDFNVSIDASDIKTVNNKAIIKGHIPARVLYSLGGELGVYETEFSFTEIADLDMANPDSVLSSYFDICNVSYTPSVSNDETLVELDIRVKGTIRTYETMEYDLVSDLYSPDYTYCANHKDAKLEYYTSLNESQITLKDILTTDNSNAIISKIHYMTVYPSCKKITKEKSSVKVSGNVQTVIIYSDESGELCSTKKDIGFETDLPFDCKEDNSIFDSSVYAANYGYILNSSQEIQARTVLKVNVGAIACFPENVITDFSEDKTMPIDKTNQPSVTICYPDKSSDLWNYAVKYNTTCEDIATVNNIDTQSELPTDKPILIPKRQIL